MSVIESIQSGEYGITYGSGYANQNITISSVTVAKSFCIVGLACTNTYRMLSVGGRITSSTNLETQWSFEQAAGAGNTGTIYWQVIEFV